MKKELKQFKSIEKNKQQCLNFSGRNKCFSELFLQKPSVKDFIFRKLNPEMVNETKNIEEEEGKVTKIHTIFLTIFAFKHFTRSMKMASNDQIPKN